MKKIKKKYVILIVLLMLIILAIIIGLFLMSNSSITSNTFQNKVFVIKESDMFFVEPFEMINYNEMDKLKATRVIYFDENYVYCFVPSNSQAEDYTKIEEYKSNYTLTGDQLNFILSDFAYTGHITKDGELELEIIDANVNKDCIGEKTKYVVNDEYKYEKLKTIYLENRVNAWNKLREKLIKEIGNIIGEKRYEKNEQNNLYGFQYNSNDLTHPIIVLEKNQEYKDLIVKNARKITDNMYTISLGENETGDKVFNLVVDGKYSKITTEYLRIKVKATNPVENAAGIYTKSLQIEFDMNNELEPILESENSNSIEIPNNDYLSNDEIDNQFENYNFNNNSQDTRSSYNYNSSNGNGYTSSNDNDYSYQNNDDNFHSNNNENEDKTNQEKEQLQMELNATKEARQNYDEEINRKIAEYKNDINRLQSELEKSKDVNGDAFELQNTKYLIGNKQSIIEDYEKERKETLARYDKTISILQEKLNKLK